VLRRLVLAIILVPIVLLVGLFGYGYYKFSQIPRVTVASVLSPASGTGTNYLIVGTDSREGIDPNDPNAGAFLGEGEPTGSRTDSIMVLRVAGDQQQLLSIPRDLWVTDPGTQQQTRINATYGAGPANLIQAVKALGIPVHHYLEINFVAFGKLVDAVGGIDVDFPFAARDTNSGLNITEPGPHHLDGTQALAYVRARHYEEFKDGKWVTDPLSDLGRVMRQRAFLTALMGQVTDTRNPLSLARIGDSTSAGLKLDETLSLVDVIQLGLKLRGFHPESLTLPTTPRTTGGGAAVLELQKAQAQPIIDQFAG
jgi:LCP family protein required for cell wall assembly